MKNNTFFTCLGGVILVTGCCEFIKYMSQDFVKSLAIFIACIISAIVAFVCANISENIKSEPVKVKKEDNRKRENINYNCVKKIEKESKGNIKKYNEKI